MDSDHIPVNTSTVSVIKTRTEIFTADELAVAFDVLNVIVVFINVFGLVTNIWNIVIFKRMGLTDSVTFCLFVQSIIDFVYLLTETMFSSFLLMLSLIQHLNIDTSIILYVQPISVALAPYKFSTYDMSMSTTAYIAIQRCCCVASPLHFKHFFTRQRSAFVIAVIAVYVIASKMPSFIAYGLKIVAIPTSNRSMAVLIVRAGAENIRKRTDLFTFTIFPACLNITVFVCFLILAVSLKKSARFRQSSTLSRKDDDQTNPKDDKSTQVVKTVLFMSVLFLVTNLPRCICSVLYRTIPSLNVGNYLFPLNIIIYMCAFVMESLNASFNFIIYYKCNTRFRSTFTESFEFLLKPQKANPG